MTRRWLDLADMLHQEQEKNRRLEEQLDRDSNHYERYWGPRPERRDAAWRHDTRVKMQQGLTDPFCHESADVMLALLDDLETALWLLAEERERCERLEEEVQEVRVESVIKEWLRLEMKARLEKIVEGQSDD